MITLSFWTIMSKQRTAGSSWKSSTDRPSLMCFPSSLCLYEASLATGSPVAATDHAGQTLRTPLFRQPDSSLSCVFKPRWNSVFRCRWLKLTLINMLIKRVKKLAKSLLFWTFNVGTWRHDARRCVSHLATVRGHIWPGNSLTDINECDRAREAVTRQQTSALAMRGAPEKHSHAAVSGTESTC